MWKWLLAFAVIFIGAAAAGGYFIAQSKEFRELLQNFNPSDKPLEVRIGKVEKGTLTRTINAPGTIEPKTKVQISAQVSARIVALPFREGESVKAGDVVVRLDARDLAAALESAQASKAAEEARLEGNRATLARARAEVERQRQLAASGDTSKSALEQAETDLRRAETGVEASTHAIEIARANIARATKDLENTEIRAPFDGTITKLNAEVGELVVIGTLNNAASVIMEIADLNVMLLKARVDEANIAPVKAGQPAKVFINAFRGREFEATVDRVGLKRETDRDGTGYYIVEVLVKKPEGEVLYSGLTANTDIAVESLYDVLKIPSQAIVDRRVDELPKEARESPLVDRTKAFARVVYTLVDGKTAVVPVTVGPSDLTHTVLTAGVEEGKPVVVGSFKTLVDLRHDRKAIDEATKKKDEQTGVTATPGTAVEAKSAG